MGEDKRFKAVPNQREVWDIIDYEESEKIDGLVIYNDVGSIYFSSAPQLCDLLNGLSDENGQLKDKMGKVHDYFMQYLDELRDEMDYDLFCEMWDMVKELEIK